MKNTAKQKSDESKATGKNEPQGEERKPLPGEYPPQEDIMNKKNTSRVELDVENFSRTIGPENFNKPNEPLTTNPNDIMEAPGSYDIEDPEPDAAREMEWPVPKNLKSEEDLVSDEFTTGNESDVTAEDLEALGPKDLSMDMGDDERILKNRVWPVDMTGKDLDIPGTELDDSGEMIGAEDEENNSYSLGGDRHEDSLEGKDNENI